MEEERGAEEEEEKQEQEQEEQYENVPRGQWMKGTPLWEEMSIKRITIYVTRLLIVNAEE